MRLLPIIFSLAILRLSAQPYDVPQVPHKMNFAGITLTIRDDAQREIQKEVNALRQSPKHFTIKVERAKTYFPIIEKIFAEERVPDDFKYLVLQESALIADAVSVSNAVGFWQFKDYTALEMGLRVDDVVDERMNIYSATRGAARYLKRNNYQFNNWVYALQAYQMGAGGVSRSVRDVQSGTRHMEINSSTYWYVKKFLAHKIAFENSINGNPQQPVSAYENRVHKTVNEIAVDLSIEATDLLAYNKWIKKDFIPNDKTYSVVVPLPEKTVAKLNTATDNTVASTTSNGIVANTTVTINGVPAIIAQTGESMMVLAKRAGVSLPSFMSLNDLQGHEKIITGMPYFTSRKKLKADRPYAEAKTGEDLWMISQRYGVSLSKLKKYNRITDISLTVGQQVWLTGKKPKTLPSETTVMAVATDEKFFSWSVTPDDDIAEKISTAAEIVDQSNSNVTQYDTTHKANFNHSAASVDSSETSKTIHTDSSDSLRVKLNDNEILIVPEFHIVQPGENLYSICKRYRLKMEEVAIRNRLGDNMDVVPNQKIYLSDNQKVNTEPALSNQVHEVKPSDTLYSIARQYGVTIKQLMDWNNKKDFSLTVGEKLKVSQR
jgi:membrane-bound lytic murein transglycosylase D